MSQFTHINAIMESLNIKTYLLYAFYIVRTNPTILLFVGLIGLINAIGTYLPKSNLTDIAAGITFVALIFIQPVIYGVYYEIIEDKYSSPAKIFMTYVPGYLLLLFCLYLPIIFITSSFISSPQADGNIAFFIITIVIFSLLYLYVVPSYYLSRTLFDSILSGVAFLFSNLLPSAPVLLMALLSELLLLLTQYKMAWLKEMSLLFYVFVEFSVYMLSSIIDFLLFITLIYILKNHRATQKTPPA